MLNAGDSVYKGFTYRVSSTVSGDGRVQGEVWVARNDAHGQPTGEVQKIFIDDYFRNLRAAQDEADRRIKAMIDGDIPGLIG